MITINLKEKTKYELGILGSVLVEPMWKMRWSTGLLVIQVNLSALNPKMFIPQNGSWHLFLTPLHRIHFNFFFIFRFTKCWRFMQYVFKTEFKGDYVYCWFDVTNSFACKCTQTCRCKSVCWVKLGMDPRAFFSSVNLYFATRLKYSAWRYS